MHTADDLNDNSSFSTGGTEMSEVVQVNGRVIPDLVIPADFTLVREEEHVRNKENVVVLRYQAEESIEPNNEHVTVIYGADGRLTQLQSIRCHFASWRLPMHWREENWRMDEFHYEQTVKQLGKLNERLRQLTETDYATAIYKGYSASSLTLAEVQAEVAATESQISRLEERLQDLR